jgi:tetratricopeptide (TPR) repeat protein
VRRDPHPTTLQPGLVALAAVLLTLPLQAAAQPKPAPAAATAGTTAQATGPGGVAIGQMTGGTVQVGLDAEQVRRLLAASGKEQERLLRELVTLITRQLNQQAATTAQATQAAQAQGQSTGYTEGLVQFFFQLMLGKNVPQADWPKTFTELVQRDQELQARIAETREATPAASSRITQLLDQAEAARRAGQPGVAERRLEEADRLASAEAQASTDRAREDKRRAAQVRHTRATAAFARLEREQGAGLLQGAFDQRADDITVETLWWLIQAGDEWQTAGQSARALLAYQRAQRSANAMAAMFPEDRAWQREQSVCHNKIGDILRAQGDGPPALRSYQASLAIAQSLAAADPRNTEWQRGLSVSHDRIGGILRAQGDGPAALRNYQAGLAIAQSLAAADPRNTEWQRDLSVSHDNIGDILRAQGDGPAALRSYQASLAIAQSLAAADPRDTEWQRDLSIGHNKIGDILRAQGDGPAALRSYQASLAIRQSLAAADPGNVQWQTDVAVSCWNLAQVQTQEHPVADRRARLAAGLAILERLQSQNRLTAAQQGWPAAFRQALADLDGTSAAR